MPSKYEHSSWRPFLLSLSSNSEGYNAQIFRRQSFLETLMYTFYYLLTLLLSYTGNLFNIQKD